MTAPSMVYILDDDSALAESLAWMVESIGYKTQSFSSAKLFLQHYNPKTPSCLLLDVRMPEISGPELQEKLIANNIAIPIVFISGHVDISVVVRVMKKGAIDFLCKPINDQQLLESINKAIRKDQFRREQQAKHAKKKVLIDQLSEREFEIMHHLSMGKANKVIASELHISLKTVETHRANIMKKLEARSLADLIKMALMVNTLN